MSNQPELPRVEYEDINPVQGTLNKELDSMESEKSGIAFEPGDVLYGKLRPYLMNWLFPQFRGSQLEISGAETYRMRRVIPLPIHSK